jgi:hypothetical protein
VSGDALDERGASAFVSAREAAASARAVVAALALRAPHAAA